MIEADRRFAAFEPEKKEIGQFLYGDFWDVVDNMDTNNSVAGITSLSPSAMSSWLPLKQIPPIAWRSQKTSTRALVLKYQKSPNEFWMQVVNGFHFSKLQLGYLSLCTTPLSIDKRYLACPSITIDISDHDPPASLFPLQIYHFQVSAHRKPVDLQFA
ncbi:MAG: hypothetical protein WA151_08280 [Desulfatirhabdiaceae bacterium]